MSHALLAITCWNVSLKNTARQLFCFCSTQRYLSDDESRVGQTESGVTESGVTESGVTETGITKTDRVRGVSDGGRLGINGGRDLHVGNGDGGGNVLDDGGDGSVSVALMDLISEVSAQTVALDVSGIVSRSADQGGSRDDEGVGGGQANQENSQLVMEK